MCDINHHYKYIYQVSLLASKKHIKPVYSKYYLTEEETRFIYNDPDVCGVYDDGVMKISVIRVLENSKEYKLAFSRNLRNSKNINFILKKN